MPSIVICCPPLLKKAILVPFLRLRPTAQKQLVQRCGRSEFPPICVISALDTRGSILLQNPCKTRYAVGSLGSVTFRLNNTKTRLILGPARKQSGDTLAQTGCS